MITHFVAVFCVDSNALNTLLVSEILEGLVSTSKWPRNGAKFLASSRPRPRKTRIKSLVLKMAEKKAEIPRNSSSRPRKGRGKGKNSSPRLVLGKILPKVSTLTSSSYTYTLTWPTINSKTGVGSHFGPDN